MYSERDHPRPIRRRGRPAPVTGCAHRAVVLFPAMVELGVRDVIAEGGYPIRLVIA
jgi:hypothetical protein